jgi:VWFA-related protein
MNNTPMRTLVPLVALSLWAPLIAQQPAFKAGVELVRIPVTLTQGGKPVEPGVVTEADFKVTEDGVEQQVLFFRRESLPLSICVVFDTSSSMGQGSVLPFATAAMRQVLTRLLPDDEVAIIGFAGTPLLLAPWTPAPDITKLALHFEAYGSTSLNDAVLHALKVMNTARNPRPVILLITDGEENSSRVPLSQLVTTRRQSETQLYAFHVLSAARTVGMVSPNGGDNPGPAGARMFEVLPVLIGDSGGFTYRATAGGAAAALARSFVDELRFQYTLGYSPIKPLDRKYRRVKVNVKKRGFGIRHRGGYLALPMP